MNERFRSNIYNWNQATQSTVGVRTLAPQLFVCQCATEKIDESVGVCLLAVLAVQDGGRRMLAVRVQQVAAVQH